ncbi:toxin secretion ATP-binding protein [Campylobacter sputorum subsp. bubulus]|uniref:Toxin secretion ATP-binding protein n=2 Tax=Campylobacter sputorum TaxID=206 RepID=A0A381DJH6_9BACT|nr:type I secretion system permease/ATPase [Campylobacter sputorum]ASM35804.1 type I secretion system, ABC transporter, ATP-binding/permease components [Campylobacter sputorum aubsp. sputorum RM3237]KAB0581510.1 type I secretion system permease/ATPase [Campylobacter sputorum subsp. sputorum]QEL05994.1 type I secretion system ATPase/permease, PrtD family [Campylobacter sputorum subsp. sputorum]SUX09094.1 toxin secretion ATP-binding protein [Campylobacter sputorum subsp. bubulus]SUX10785.1 toxin
MKINEIKQTIIRSKKCIIYAAIFSAFVNVLMLTPPLYMLQLYGRVVTSRSLDTLFFLTLIVVFLYICLGFFEILRSKLLIIFANQIDLNLSERIYDATFKLASANPGKTSSQAMSDLNSIKQYLSTNGVFAFLDAPWLPFYIFILFIFHPYFGYFSIVSAIILFSIALLNEKATKKGLQISNETYRSEMKFIDTNLRNSEVIQAMGMNQSLKDIWSKKHNIFLTTHSESSLKAGIYTNLSKTVRVASQSLMLGLGAYLVVKMEINPGMMIAGSIIMGRALAPLDLLISSWKSYKNTKESYQRLSKFLEEFPKEGEHLTLPDPKGDISLETVSMIPPGSKTPTLIGINLALNAGDMCAFIGPSAAGKSSLARVVLGIWPIFNGVVRIDGADIRQYSTDHIGKFVGYLPQDVELFEGSVAQNISRFGELDSKAIIEAAKSANVHEMILNLPNGYDTKIGVGGMSLSGGQRQRIALARALYKNPKIIVLDEPNASLDEEGERALFNTLLALKGKATIVLITHKLNVLKAVDKIAVLSDGKLVCFGQRDAVLTQLAGAKPQIEPKNHKISLDDSKDEN